MQREVAMFSPKRIIPVILIIIAALALWHFSKPKSAQTATAKIGDIVEAVYATGVVEPVNWVKITPEIAGLVTEVPAKEGQEVKTGDPLLIMDDSEQVAARDAAIANSQFLEKEIARQQVLHQKNFASGQALEKATSDRNEALAEIRRLNALIAKKHINSPIDGVVLKRDVEVGERLQPLMPFQDVKEIFWVGQMKPLRVTAEVDEEDIGQVKPGMKALMKADAFPGKITEGVVDSITLKGDPVNKNFRVRISLPDDTPLMIGMTVEVNIITNEAKGVITVPLSSVRGDYVWVKSWRGVEKRKITLGTEGENSIEIKNGVKEGDDVLINPPVGE